MSGVVERASKELSRRFTSFAARTRRGSKHEKLEDITEHKHKEDNSEQVTWTQISKQEKLEDIWGHKEFKQKDKVKNNSQSRDKSLDH